MGLRNVRYSNVSAISRFVIARSDYNKLFCMPDPSLPLGVDHRPLSPAQLGLPFASAGAETPFCIFNMLYPAPPPPYTTQMALSLDSSGQHTALPEYVIKTVKKKGGKGKRKEKKKKGKEREGR